MSAGPTDHSRSLIPALAIASLLAVLLACSLGETPMALSKVLASLFGGGDAVSQTIVWSIRLPRALAAWIQNATGGLSSVTKPAGSKALKKNRCQLCSMLRTPAA